MIPKLDSYHAQLNAAESIMNFAIHDNLNEFELFRMNSGDRDTIDWFEFWVHTISKLTNTNKNSSLFSALKQA